MKKVLLYTIVILANIAVSYASDDIYDVHNTYYPTIKDVGLSTSYNPDSDTLYNLVNIGYSNSSRQIQVTKKINGNYQLIQKITVQTDDNSSKVFKLKLVGNYLLVIGSDYYLRYKIEDNGSLLYFDKKSVDINFFGQFIEVNENLLADYHDNSLSINFYEVDTINGTLNFLFSKQNIPELSALYINKLVYNTYNNELWLFSHSVSELTLIVYDIASNSITEKNRLFYNYKSDYDSANNSPFSTIKLSSNGSQFYINNGVAYFFFEISNTSELLLVNRINLGAELRSPAIASHIKTNYFIGDVFMSASGQLEVFAYYVDWENMTITKTPIILSYSDLHSLKFVTENLIFTKGGFFEFYNGTIGEKQAINYSFFPTLPDNVSHNFNNKAKGVVYNKESQQLVFLGSTWIEPPYSNTLNIWKYNENNNALTFLDSYNFIISASDKPFTSLYLAGVFKYNYYVIRNTNNDYNYTELLHLSLIDNKLQLISSTPIMSNGYYPSVAQTLKINESTLAMFYGIGENFYISYCHLDDEGKLINCEEKPLLANLEFDLSSFSYYFHFLKEIDSFLFAPKSNVDMINKSTPSAIILKYDSQAEQFVVQQQIPLSKSDSSYRPYQGVSRVLLVNNGKDLFITSDKVYYYSYDNAAKKWILTEQLSGPQYADQDLITVENNYLIDRFSGQSFLYSANDKTFYYSEQYNNIATSNAWYLLTSPNKGIMVAGSNRVSLSTFSFVNRNPSKYKGGFDLQRLDAIQDKPIEINIGQYFINGNKDSIKVTGLGEDLHPKLSWDGEFIRGKLTNEDMFYSPFDEDPTPAEPFQVRISFSNRVLYFYIVPKNVNDAPVLLEPLGIQYLKVNETYSGELYGIVKDPDREEIFFSYKNLPKGFTGEKYGRIEGTITKKGQYTIEVTATDPQGANLTFNLILNVTSTGEKEVESNASTSGGTTGKWLLILLLYSFLLRRKRV